MSISTPPPTAQFDIDCYRQLGLVPNNTGAKTINKNRLNAKLADRNVKGRFNLPGDDWYFDGTITPPERTGFQFRGVSWSRNASAADFVGSGWGGNSSTRLRWHGNNTDPQIFTNGWGTYISDMLLGGQEVGQSRCKIGIHYKPNPNPTPPNAAHLFLDNLFFDGHEIGILMRRDLTAQDGSGNFSADQDPHADNLYINRAIFRQMQDSAVWVGTDQSAGNYINRVSMVGAANADVPIFRIERGGKTGIGEVSVLNNCTIFEVHRQSTNNNDLFCGHFILDGQVTDCALVNFKNDFPLNRTAFSGITFQSGMIPHNAGFVSNWLGNPMVDCGSPSAGRFCTINLYNVHYIPPRAFRLNGLVDGTDKYICRLNCYNCGFNLGTNSLAEAMTTDSTVLWEANFFGCYDRFSTNVTSNWGVGYRTTIGGVSVPIVSLNSGDLPTFA